MKGTTAVTVYTQVYNTKPFLARCVESVLRQTLLAFQYIIIDNGSTDGCKEMLEKYAARDNRITLIRYDQNMDNPWRYVVPKFCSGKYITNLDSDDWLEPDFLERMVNLAEQGQLDIVCTGTAFHIEGQDDRISGTRTLPQRLVMGKPEYAAYLPYYHAFFRTIWGKLIRKEVFMTADISIIEREGISNGADTLSAFAWLRQSKRICVDNSILHHYLLRKKSVSHIYRPNRFKSNTLLHQDAVDFLSQYGPVSQQNLHFLHIVYANAVYDTLEVLWNSNLPPEEKLAEYCTIALHPTTQEAFQDTDPAIDRSRESLFRELVAVASTSQNWPENLTKAMSALRPRCGHAYTDASVPLFQREPAMLNALRQDNWDAMVECIMTFIIEKRYVKQFDLGGMIDRLIPESNPLSGTSDVRFFQKHTEICMLLLCENYSAALGQMTGVLFENKKIYSKEVFLGIYLRLAVLERQDAAFVFGKLCLAELCFQQGRYGECRGILDELTELGVEENAELAALRTKLDELETI